MNIQYNFNNKIVLVTGGSRGIGRDIAIKFAKSGAKVAINYFRNKQAAEETEDIIRKFKGEVLLIKGNVAEEKYVEKIVEEIKEKWGKLDILIANAASGVLKPALEINKKHWEWTMNINAFSLITLIQKIKEISYGDLSVVVISSLGSKRGIPNYSIVGASKAALESIVRHLTVELSQYNIRLNCVSAGTVETDALKHFPNREEIIKEAYEKTPSKRLTTPEDISNLVLFLSSEESNQIRGQTIVIDGGYSIST